MKTETFKEEEMQRIPQHDPTVPTQIGGQFILFKVDLAYAAQQQPEMTDDEVLIANQALGGFDWMNDPAEEVY